MDIFVGYFGSRLVGNFDWMTDHEDHKDYPLDVPDGVLVCDLFFAPGTPPVTWEFDTVTVFYTRGDVLRCEVYSGVEIVDNRCITFLDPPRPGLRFRYKQRTDTDYPADTYLTFQMMAEETRQKAEQRNEQNVKQQT